MSRAVPEWFAITDAATSIIMQKVAHSVENLNLDLQIRSAPMLAHWFLLDALFLSHQANKEGMHANALALSRQCLEAITIIEIGVCGHSDAGATLLKWNNDDFNPGKLRAWLEEKVWPQYGSGLWAEPWSVFMREFAKAIQPYAHYGRSLAQWQVRLHAANAGTDKSGRQTALIEMRPRAYDGQKATRITLFHAILTYTLGRILIASDATDTEFRSLVVKLGIALSKSRYLDGHQTNWGQQFWAMLWDNSGDTILE